MRFEQKWKHNSKSEGKHIRLYNTWKAMLKRCTDPKDKSFKNYGERGISVCTAWFSFDEFYEWAMDSGYQDGLTIDRIDNNSGYCPENCRWADRKDQSRNRRNVRLIGGETIAEIANRVGLSYSTVYYRVTHGCDLEAPLDMKKSSRGDG